MDNTLYQGALGLLDDKQLENVRNAIEVSYPIWMLSGALIPQLVAQCHQEMNGTSDAS
jgi:hypothetical protein